MTDSRGWVVVTGASRGIGRAAAEALAAVGFDLILWARSGDALADVASQIRRHGGRVRYASVDVGSASSVDAATASCLEENLTLTGLVLNAGHGVWTALDALDAKEWNGTVDTNLHGTFNVLRIALPRLVDGNGLIIGLLSDSAIYPFAHRAAYSAAKAGMRALLEVTRLEVRERGVRVSLIFLSRVDTFFSGSHVNASPGTRLGALSAADVAGIVKSLFEQPPAIEIRETHLSAMTATFGPFIEKVEL